MRATVEQINRCDNYWLLLGNFFFSPPDVLESLYPQPRSCPAAPRSLVCPGSDCQVESWGPQSCPWGFHCPWPPGALVSSFSATIGLSIPYPGIFPPALMFLTEFLSFFLHIHTFTQFTQNFVQICGLNL